MRPPLKATGTLVRPMELGPCGTMRDCHLFPGDFARTYRDKRSRLRQHVGGLPDSTVGRLGEGGMRGLLMRVSASIAVALAAFAGIRAKL